LEGLQTGLWLCKAEFGLNFFGGLRVFSIDDLVALDAFHVIEEVFEEPDNF